MGILASMEAVSAIGLGSIRDAVFAVLGFAAAYALMLRVRRTPPRRSYWESSGWASRPAIASVILALAMAGLAEVTLLAFGNPFRPTAINPACAVALGLLLGVEAYLRLSRLP